MTESELTWHCYFLNLLNPISLKSKDTRTKVGAIIVGEDHEIRSTGYNGLPRKVNDNIAERYEYPLKASYFEHAERNSIYNAAKVGIPTNNSTIYISFLPCNECTRAIIQAGIKRIVYLKREQDFLAEKYKDSQPDWYKNLPISWEMLREAEIDVIGI